MTKRAAIVVAAAALEGNAYVMGGTGQQCTVDYRKARAEQYPGSAAAIKKNCQRMSGKASSCSGCRWQGKKCYDCAQATKAAAKAAGFNFVSGATSQWNKTDWLRKGAKKDFWPEDTAGIFYFRQEADGKTMAHTAVGIGNGMVIEAMSHDTGVVRRELAKRSFTHAAELPGMDDPVDSPTPGPVTHPTLHSGSSGSEVVLCQQRLILHGQALSLYGADGKYGNETVAAVRAFQQIKGLFVDGITGKDTWAKLLEEPAAESKGYRGIVLAAGHKPLTAEQTVNLADDLAPAGYVFIREEV